MEIPMKFLVTARHTVPKYALSQAEVEARQVSDGRWYVHLSPYGCSKDYGSAADAIVGLLADNGCTGISVKPLPLVYYDAMGLEEGLLLAKQYDDKSEAEGSQVFRIDYDPAYWRETHGFSSGKELWDYLDGVSRS